MFAFPHVIALYQEFYRVLGKPQLFKWKRKNTLEYADVFPVIYLKSYFEGTASFDFIKHLLIDEMQDYTPIQYAVFSKLFSCKKTILGDSSQTVNPYASSSLTDIKKVFPGAETVELVKSYRSTLEIASFAQQLKRNSKLVPIERHGEEPQITKLDSMKDELDEICHLIRDFLQSDLHSLGIICKTQMQAEHLFDQIKHVSQNIHLVDFNSMEFKEGITVISAYMAKGLEFDQVVVPLVNAENYRTDLDRSLLYIACTRAMHKLNLTYSGDRTSLWEIQ